MKAAVLHEFKTPLSLEEIARPEPADGEVLVRVEACGLCHSDVHVADGDWPQFNRILKRPLVLGHEIAGRIAAVGHSVEGWAIGDRAGIPWIHWTCGECELCRDGNENLCARQQITGVTVDGGFAEFVKAPASHVARIPEGLESAASAPLFCAGVTVYRALSKANIRPGQRLGVFGVGGLGCYALQMGRELGADVLALDISDDKLERARKLGARQTFNAATPGVHKELRRAGGLHVALVTSGSKAAYDAAFQCLRPTGTLLVVGLPAEHLCFPAVTMAAGEVHIQASTVGTRADLAAVLDMAAAGKLESQVETRPLAAVNEALDDLRHGRVSGRIVILPAGL